MVPVVMETMPILMDAHVHVDADVGVDAEVGVNADVGVDADVGVNADVGLDTVVGLDADVADQDPAALSSGMRKRVGLARAIATEPEIIFFDEPTTGLDPLMGDLINELIVRCVRETGASTLTITHDMASARMIGDRVAMLYGGKVIWDGPAGQIDDSGNPFVDQFIHGREEGPFELAV